mgnify:CR=1 FL=1
MSKDINRRDFLKLAGVAASASLLAACGKKTGNNTSGGEAMATGEMTYHKPLQLGDDKISLLGSLNHLCFKPLKTRQDISAFPIYNT